MTDVLAYLALVVTIPAMLLGHQGQDWPLAGAWRWVRARMPRAGRCAPAGGLWGALRLPRGLRGAPEVSGGRVRLRPPRLSRPEFATTGPSRPRIRRQGAPQAPGEGFPAPNRQRPAEARLRPQPTWSPR